ncbi:hypothetical protein [Rhodanobacter denitrificans]|nr:hypothetical protein [Rhodanobacter denitrificans]UJM85099.1 hypothetical protein LRJ86_09915 [Rhodanobacter denitrificans]
MEIAAEASYQRHILALAAAFTRPSLYIQIPSGKAAYSSNLKRSVHDDTSWQTQQRVAEARSKGVLVIRNPTLCHDISFVALAPEDVRRLAITGVVHVQRFIGGVKAISAQGDPEYMHAVLCLRPALEPVGSSPLILDSPEHATRVELRDVLLDRGAMGLLTGLADADGGDNPFNLQVRAPGVFVLYAAAKHFFGPNPPDSFNQGTVKKWLLDHRNQAVSWAYRSFNNYKELATEANRRLACKLIDTRYDLDKIDRRKRPGKPLDAKGLQKAMAYRRGGYVSDRLSLVALAVEKWAALTEANPAPESGAAAIASHQLDLVDKLRRELLKWGIDSTSERDSVVDFVTWPKLAADYRKARKEQRASRKTLLVQNTRHRAGSR